MKCVFVQARYYLNRGTRSDFYQRFRDNNIREFSRSEDGNLEYEIYLPLDSDDDVCILEKWKDTESQKQHMQTLHYAILSELKAKYVKKVEIKKAWLEEIPAETSVAL
ncbi:MAG: antibiotic biosynthesis monooxygenase [Treponema sp.]|nr:antibiotic biosynthesis monooxygenase [Candidatus Treponema equifaecale]